jgi:hypothetical protein
MGAPQCIGWAVEQMKAGQRVARRGWNGRGMYLAYKAGYPEGIAINWPCPSRPAIAGWGDSMFAGGGCYIVTEQGASITGAGYRALARGAGIDLAGLGRALEVNY